MHAIDASTPFFSNRHPKSSKKKKNQHPSQAAGEEIDRSIDRSTLGAKSKRRARGAPHPLPFRRQTSTSSGALPAARTTTERDNASLFHSPKVFAFPLPCARALSSPTRTITRGTCAYISLDLLFPVLAIDRLVGSPGWWLACLAPRANATGPTTYAHDRRVDRCLCWFSNFIPGRECRNGAPRQEELRVWHISCCVAPCNFVLKSFLRTAETRVLSTSPMHHCPLILINFSITRGRS